MPNDLILINNDYLCSSTLFKNEQQKLLDLLKNFDIIIEHFGSTAVPNTVGKGIIDVLIACNSNTDQELIKDILVTADYRQGELNKQPDGRLFFCNTSGQTHAGDTHLHLVIKNTPNHLDVIKLKNYLLQHPETVKSYNQEKLRLAQVTNNDRTQYVSQKTEFMKKLIAEVEES